MNLDSRPTHLTEQETQNYRERYLSEAGEIMGIAQLLRQEGREKGWEDASNARTTAVKITRTLSRNLGRLGRCVVGFPGIERLSGELSGSHGASLFFLHNTGMPRFVISRIAQHVGL